MKKEIEEIRLTKFSLCGGPEHIAIGSPSKRLSNRCITIDFERKWDEHKGEIVSLTFTPKEFQHLTNAMNQMVETFKMLPKGKVE